MTLSELRTEITLNSSFDLYLKEGESPTSAQLTDLANRARRLVNRRIRPYDPAVVPTLVADQATIRFDQDCSEDIINLNTPTSGGWKLTFAGTETSALTITSTASDVQSALVALAAVGTGDVSVGLTNALTRQYHVRWKGQFKGIPVGALTITSNTLSGGTATANIARLPQVSKRILQLHGGVLNGQRVRKSDGTYGVWPLSEFTTRFPRYLSQASGTSRFITVDQNAVRIYPAPDSSFITTSSGTNFLEATVIERDLINVQDDETELPEPIDLHEVIAEVAVLLSAPFMSNEAEAWRRLQEINSRAIAEIGVVARRNAMARYSVGDVPIATRFRR